MSVILLQVLHSSAGLDIPDNIEVLSSNSISTFFLVFYHLSLPGLESIGYCSLRDPNPAVILSLDLAN